MLQFSQRPLLIAVYLLAFTSQLSQAKKDETKDKTTDNALPGCELCDFGLKWPLQKIDAYGRTCVEQALEIYNKLDPTSLECQWEQLRYSTSCCTGDVEPPQIEQLPTLPPVVHGYGGSGGEGVCELCWDGKFPGDSSMVIAMLDIGVGAAPCDDFYYIGQEGLIPPHLCQALQYFAYEPCGCAHGMDVASAAGSTTPSPTAEPTVEPTMSPSTEPPTEQPTSAPSTELSTPTPSSSPTGSPTGSPSKIPTGSPTDSPTGSPTDSPTDPPTDPATGSPTDSPTGSPTDSPTDAPTNYPTLKPTNEPTLSPTDDLTLSPTDDPTSSPTGSPSEAPTGSPTFSPTGSPTEAPTEAPTGLPTEEPKATPTASPNNESPNESPGEGSTELEIRVTRTQYNDGKDSVPKMSGNSYGGYGSNQHWGRRLRGS